MGGPNPYASIPIHILPSCPPHTGTHFVPLYHPLLRSWFKQATTPAAYHLSSPTSPNTRKQSLLLLRKHKRVYLPPPPPRPTDRSLKQRTNDNQLFRWPQRQRQRKCRSRIQQRQWWFPTPQTTPLKRRPLRNNDRDRSNRRLLLMSHALSPQLQAGD